MSRTPVDKSDESAVTQSQTEFPTAPEAEFQTEPLDLTVKKDQVLVQAEMAFRNPRFDAPVCADCFDATTTVEQMQKRAEEMVYLYRQYEFYGFPRTSNFLSLCGVLDRLNEMLEGLVREDEREHRD